MAHKLISGGEVGIPGMMVDIFGSPGGRYIPDWVWQKKYSGGGLSHTAEFTVSTGSAG